MKLHAKLPPAPRLPQGLIALVRASQPVSASPSVDAEPAEPVEATRAWKPDRSLLQPDPPAAGSAEFEQAAEERTMVGAANLHDPSLFRSQPPPSPLPDASAEGSEDEDSTIEFAGSLLDPDRDEAPTTASIWSDEKTRLYRPERAHLVPEEPSDDCDAAEVVEEAGLHGPQPPKVILAADVLADPAPDPARAEATKKKRRRRQRTDTKLGLCMCLVGGFALALSAAWRHPKSAPVTHDAFARVAAVAAGLLSR